MRKKTVQFFIVAVKLILWIQYFGKAGIKAEDITNALTEGSKEYEKYGGDEPVVVTQLFGKEAEKFISDEQKVRSQERMKIIGTLNRMIDTGYPTQQYRTAIEEAIGLVQDPDIKAARDEAEKQAKERAERDANGNA